MQFVPFKPINSTENSTENSTTKIKTNIEQYQKNNVSNAYKMLRRDKNMFIKKYKLIELVHDDNTPNHAQNTSYYYDNVSNTIYEINSNLPSVFMKTNKNISNYLMKLNNLI